MSEFITVERQAPQDWPAITHWLHQQGLELEPGSVRQFASGLANLNFLLTVNGKRAVLRRPPSGPLPPGAYDLARQHRVMSRLGAHFRYTPAALAYCTDASVIGVPFLLIEFREGVAISRTLPVAFQGVPEVGARLSALMVNSLAELHAVSPTAAGLEDLGKPQGFNARQVQAWLKRASLVMQGEPLRSVQAITQWLAAHLPPERPACILHLDYKLDNVLVHLTPNKNPATLAIGGVVDWEMATLGDPMFDLALMLVVWGDPGDTAVYQRNACTPTDAPGWWTRRQALQAYLARTGLSLTEDELRFYWLLALLRNVVACAQLVALYQREAMPNASTLDLATLVEEGIAHAHKLLDKPLDW
jgi:aminoglycoside phosphotransferase (APT) family kinase protein